MKYALILICLLIPFSLMMTQTLSETEAAAYAERLHEKQILSKKGAEALLAFIRKNVEQKIELDDMDRITFEPKVLSVPLLLGFLTDAFSAEYYHRTGFAFKMEWADKIKKTKEAGHTYSAEEIAELKQQIQHLLEDHRGIRIEEAIADEENIPPQHMTRYEIGGRFITETEYQREAEWIHPNRSALGKTTTRTLNDLLQIGLIDQDTHADVQQRMQESQRRWIEVEVVAYAQQRAAYHATYAAEKQKELALLTKLQQQDVFSQ